MLTFARLAVTDPALADHAYKVELAANWRAPPLMMDIGPVLHIHDVVAGKMSALCSTEALKSAVRAGVGASVLNYLAVAGDVRVGTLRTVRVPRLKLDRDWAVWVPGGLSASALLRAVGTETVRR
ncbi:MAG: hypothetical protein QOE61_823 [Micromonosporaceae bacterium]|nr:hypothetical protein [Micromonosporaceae bacterium]